MAEFEILLTDEAKADLRHLSQSVRDRLLDKLEWLGSNAALLVHQPLKGAQWAGIFKYRVGDYRLLYKLDVEKSASHCVESRPSAGNLQTLVYLRH